MSPLLLDLLLLGCLLLGVWRGARTGAIIQVAGLVGVLLAFWLAALLMHPVGALVTAAAGLPEAVAPAAGFVTVGAVVGTAVMVAAFVARGTLRLMRLDVLDRGAGAALGGAKAAVLLSLLLLLTASPAIPGSGGLIVGPEARRASALYAPLKAVAPALWEGLRRAGPGWQARLHDRFAVEVRSDDR